MEYTSNYNLAKPEMTDTVAATIPLHSSNMDTIETALTTTTATIKGRKTAGTGTMENLSASDVKTLLDVDDLETAMLEKTSYGVYTGLGVTAQSTPDMTVKVATGTIYMSNGNRWTPAKNDALAIDAADATNPRIDIVYVNSSGVISYLAGTAAASPTAPTTPAGGQKLAEISVPANDTTIETAQIQDRRKNIYTEAWIYPTLLNGWEAFSGSYSTARFYKDNLGIVHLSGTIKGGAHNTAVFTLPAGYRPDMVFYSPVFASGVTGHYLLIGNIADGTITARYTGTLVFLSLDGVSFRAA